MRGGPAVLAGLPCFWASRSGLIGVPRMAPTDDLLGSQTSKRRRALVLSHKLAASSWSILDTHYCHRDPALKGPGLEPSKTKLLRADEPHVRPNYAANDSRPSRAGLPLPLTTLDGRCVPMALVIKAGTEECAQTKQRNSRTKLVTAFDQKSLCPGCGFGS